MAVPTQPAPSGAPAAVPADVGRVGGAVAFTVLAWASAFVAIRHLGSDVGPGALAAGRLLVGTLALWSLWAATTQRRWVAPDRREWALLLAYGVGWFGVYNVALNAAERSLDAGTTAMLVNVGPILIALLAAAFLGERLTRPLAVGAGVAFGGAVVIGLSTRDSADADLGGVLLCLVAALTYAVGVVCQKQVLRRLPSAQVTATGCTIGAICCLPFVPSLLGDLGDAGLGSAGWIAYLGVVPTALAFSTWGYALGRMDAGRLGVTTYLVPPLAALGGWALLGEAPPALAFVGGALCLLGVGLSRRR